MRRIELDFRVTVDVDGKVKTANIVREIEQALAGAYLDDGLCVIDGDGSFEVVKVQELQLRSDTPELIRG